MKQVSLWVKSENSHHLDLKSFQILLSKNYDEKTAAEFPWIAVISSNDQRGVSYSMSFSIRQLLRENDEEAAKDKSVYCAQGWALGIVAKANLYFGKAPV